tara:strand:+ start:442 stop:720 length:279 start_codon:yes stop_codon:yes gene_type:complete
MNEPYVPKVNDYVIWDKGQYGSDEGWVYFFCEEYITIEISAKPKPKDQYSQNERHKMIHSLLLCHNLFWKDLRYVTSRTPYERIQHYSQCDD